MPSSSMRWRSTRPVSPEKTEHIVTVAPRASSIRACHTPCPPACRWMSAPPPWSSTVTVRTGDGANTTTSCTWAFYERNGSPWGNSTGQNARNRIRGRGVQPVDAFAYKCTLPKGVDRMTHKFQLGLDTFGDVTWDADGQRLPQWQVLRNVVAEAELADQVGLAFFGIGEHHREDFAVSAPEVVLAAIAGRTTGIRLCLLYTS